MAPQRFFKLFELELFYLVGFAFVLAVCGADTFRVQLSKQHVPVIVQNRTVMHKTAYYGSIYVGLPEPQHFTVVFDTGSGHIILPSSICETDSCKSHNAYNRSLSATSVGTDFRGAVVHEPENGNRDRATIQYGTGEVIGALFKEIICVGAPSRQPASGWRDLKRLASNCINVWMVSASKMSTNPFAHFKFDGVLGLGLPALALEKEFHVLTSMSRGSIAQSMFGIFLSKSDDVQSEITFGGVNDARFEGGAINWVPVWKPEDGFWRVKIRSLTVGGTRIPECDDGACSGIVDSGTSSLGVPKEFIKTFADLAGTVINPQEHSDGFDCRQLDGPTLQFELESFTLELRSKDYYRPQPFVWSPNATNTTDSANHSVTATCRCATLPVNMPTLGKRVFLLGEPILQHFYTAYDASNPREPKVGFAVAVQAALPNEPSQPQGGLSII